MINIGINGFGRIGRLILRITENNPNVNVVAINSRSDAKSHAMLTKYDSTYGIFEKEVVEKNGNLFIDNREIKVFQENDPNNIPWDSANVDIVVESTGIFRTKEKCLPHFKKGVKRVIISAPGTEIDGTFVMGVNENEFDAENHTVISNASCTTNCLAPVAKILDENFGIEKGIMTTIHSFTNDQNILDNSHKKDMRRARTATASIIPTSTGAAKAVSLVLPNLRGKLTGISLRVPTQTVSIVDLVINTKNSTTKEEVNKIFENNSNKYLGINKLPLVSSDFKGSNFSAIIDTEYTEVIGENLVKILAWYDNEWGYSTRLVDLIEYVSR